MEASTRAFAGEWSWWEQKQIKKSVGRRVGEGIARGNCFDPPRIQQGANQDKDRRHASFIEAKEKKQAALDSHKSLAAAKNTVGVDLKSVAIVPANMALDWLLRLRYVNKRWVAFQSRQLMTISRQCSDNLWCE